MVHILFFSNFLATFLIFHFCYPHCIFTKLKNSTCIKFIAFYAMVYFIQTFEEKNDMI